MLILPKHSYNLLMPVPDVQWREPSQAQFKDQFGNPGVQTKFRIRACVGKNYIWQGWFDSRHDADEFLWCAVTGLLKFNRSLWKLPSPEWHPDLIGDFDTDIIYEFVTTTFLTTTGSNQTYTSPVDWNNGNNTVECLGGGASGGGSGSQHSTGGGAGAYSKIANFSFATPGTTTATYNIGVGGPATTLSGGGTDGGPTWFNAAANPGVGADNSKCSAANGVGGDHFSGNATGALGGASGASWGTTKFSGGNSGSLTGASGTGGSGGGGAAGPSGAGGNGGASSSTGSNITTAGGSTNNGTTAGGAAGNNNGSSGTEFDGSHGCGSGGGGNSSATTATAGSGANYGGGGGGATGATSRTSGAGKQGLVVIVYINTKNWGYIIA